MGQVAVGLVGAGPWARTMHAPLLAAGPETRLAGVWARRPEAAKELAATHETVAFERFDELLEVCEAVAFAVPPAVQADLAVDAARQGKALLLDKPLAADLDGAIAVADAVGEAGVPSLMFLTLRYTRGVRDYLTAAAAFPAFGGRAWYVSNALLGGQYAHGWRMQPHGALLDVGPHVLDLVDAALGPVMRLRAHTSHGGWFGLQLEHENGALSDISLTAKAALKATEAGVVLYGSTPGANGDGRLALDVSSLRGEEAPTLLRSAFAAVVQTGRVDHPLGAQRGLHLQRLLDAALRGLG